MSDDQTNRTYEFQAKVELLEFKLAEAQRLAKAWEATAFQEADAAAWWQKKHKEDCQSLIEKLQKHNLWP